MSAKSREIIYTNDLNNPRYSVTPLLRSYSRKTDRSENHRFLRGMEAVSQRDVVRYPEKNINALNSIGLLFKKPELFKIGCRSSEIADVERHRPHGGVPPLRLHCYKEIRIELHEATHMYHTVTTCSVSSE